MKKLLSALLLVVFVFTIAGCGGKSDTKADKDKNSSVTADYGDAEKEITDDSADNKDSISENSTDSGNGEIVFKAPVELIEPDLKSDDISTEGMKFTYDEQGRISECYYKYEDVDIIACYTYTENAIQIITFSGDIVADDQTFEIHCDYDPKIGFVKYKGYFFKGYTFD